MVNKYVGAGQAVFNLGKKVITHSRFGGVTY